MRTYNPASASSSSSSSSTVSPMMSMMMASINGAGGGDPGKIRRLIPSSSSVIAPDPLPILLPTDPADLPRFPSTTQRAISTDRAEMFNFRSFGSAGEVVHDVEKIPPAMMMLQRPPSAGGSCDGAAAITLCMFPPGDGDGEADFVGDDGRTAAEVLQKAKRKQRDGEGHGHGGDGAKYYECLRNHAASYGSNVIDGCGEFMPGEEGSSSLEALRCAACGCHRNFHRREAAAADPAMIRPPDDGGGGGGAVSSLAHRHSSLYLMSSRSLMLPPPPPPPLLGGFIPALPLSSSTSPTPPPPPPPASGMRFLSPPAAGASPSLPELGQLARIGGGRDVAAAAAFLAPLGGGGGMALGKRFRTKFTAEQKERMREFAERIGWRIQKHEEQAVLRFCASVGVKRHVFKVWMHNNKNTSCSSSFMTSTSSSIAAAAAKSSSSNSSATLEDCLLPPEQEEDADEDDDEDHHEAVFM